MDKIPRILSPPGRSFFLFGPRATGKSTWLRQNFPDACYIDLLDSSLYLELTSRPSNLEAMLAGLAPGGWVVIDEVQKIPALLDEVHRLMEIKNLNFALSGSSARKIKRQGINLLAGRALTRNFYPFSYSEIKNNYDLTYCLEWGMLPMVQLDRSYCKDILKAYVDTYIKEEIREEGIVRSLAPFVRFLGVAGNLNAQVINAQNISREAAVPRASVDSYFSILEDTLIALFLPAYRPNIKVREQTHPKFFWFDPGVARAAASLLSEKADRIWLGGALETLVLHELRVYCQTAGKDFLIGYYRTAAGAEIDFVIETRKRRLNFKAEVVCIEVKLSENWDRKWENPIRSLKDSGNIEVKKMIGVYTGRRKYVFEGFSVLPVTEFFEELFAGNIF